MAETKRGRPRIPPDERKVGVTGVRLTDDERTLLEDAAQTAGVTISAWMRDRLLTAAKRELKRKSG